MSACWIVVSEEIHAFSRLYGVLLYFYKAKCGISVRKCNMIMTGMQSQSLMELDNSILRNTEIERENTNGKRCYKI